MKACCKPFALLSLWVGRSAIPWGRMLAGLGLTAAAGWMLTDEMSVSVPEIEQVELFLALDCGPPEIFMEPDLATGTILVTVFGYRTHRQSGIPCTRAVVGSAVPLTDLTWREYLFRREIMEIPIVAQERGGSLAVVELPDPNDRGWGGILEFTLKGGLSIIDRSRFRVDITMGHAPARQLTSEARRTFRDIAPDRLNFGLVAPLGYAQEAGFPEPVAGQTWRGRLIYRISVPYVYAVGSDSADARGYYDQSDLSQTFVSVSELELKNYFVILWSTLLGLGVGIIVETLFAARAKSAEPEV